MEKELETIFAHAVALEQAGRMKNTIYCYGKEVFILNYDKTILLRFELSPMVKPFESMLGFNANDYDSSKFSEQDGKIVFFRSGGGFERKKSCAVPGKNFNEVRALFEKFWNASFHKTDVKINLDKDVLSLLEEGLSHIEFSSENKKLVMIQRDLYSGTIIRIDRKKEGGLGLSSSKDSIAVEFGPIGIRSNDLIALFAFSRDLNMLFPDKDGYSLISGMSGKMQGILAWCLYDELGSITQLSQPITEVKNDGGQEPQERSNQQAVGGTVSSRRRKVL